MPETGRRETFRTRTAVAATLVLLAALGPGAGRATATGDCTADPGWGTVRSELTGRIFELVNQHRTARGLTALSGSGSLGASATWKARHMAAYTYMTHNDPAPPVARSAEARFETCGYPTERAGWGENIAYGYATPEAVMQAWLNSAGHRANIENPSFRTLGVGAASSSTGRIYWAQAFGTQTGSTPPPPPPSYACSNGVDDDGDAKVDYPADPGCTSSSDNDEYNASAPPPPPPPSTTVDAFPSTLALNYGGYVGGGVSSLSADDGAYFRVNASSSGNVLWWGRIVGVPNTLKTLKVTYRGLNTSPCTQTISIWNWQTGIWAALGSTTVGASEVGTTVVPTGTLADYVSGSTGNGDVAVRVGCSAYSSYSSSAELLKISYTP